MAIEDVSDEKALELGRMLLAASAQNNERGLRSLIVTQRDHRRRLTAVNEFGEVMLEWNAGLTLSSSKAAA